MAGFDEMGIAPTAGSAPANKDCTVPAFAKAIEHEELCGSELFCSAADSAACFLSCLCGSEPGKPGQPIGAQFLSCLCGSELNMGAPSSQDFF